MGNAYEKDDGIVRGVNGGPIGFSHLSGAAKRDDELSLEDLELLATVVNRDPQRYVATEIFEVKERVARLLPTALPQAELDAKKAGDRRGVAKILGAMNPATLAEVRKSNTAIDRALNQKIPVDSEEEEIEV